MNDIDNFVNKIHLEEVGQFNILKQIPDNSIDAIVTDPPYGLKFMGKKWDYDVPTIECWQECLRVLKPGGYLLAFAGTRTQHRMAVRIEDAGFEIRDMIAWVYGSGFPKSLNIGKAVDKKPKANLVKEWKKWLNIQINNCGKTKKQINKECGFTATSYIKTDNKDYWSSNLPKNGKWKIMKNVIGITTNEYDWVEEDNCEERGYVEPTGGLSGGSGNTVGNFTGKQLSNNSIDDRARYWEGWGTALKPALEPITVARKPLSEKTVVENVLKWGTGGMNIDECRVGTDITTTRRNGNSGGEKYGRDERLGSWKNPQGRFPANFIHDGSEEVLSLFPESRSGSIKGYINNIKSDVYKDGLKPIKVDITASSGSASRFFYCAKASKAERNKGLEGMEEKMSATLARQTTKDGIRQEFGGFGAKPVQNFHPTVKPIKLMIYLVKLITPPNGIVLDPFIGSGSTAIACKLLDKKYIGLDIDEEYIEIANNRINAWSNDMLVDDKEIDDKEIKEEEYGLF